MSEIKDFEHVLRCPQCNSTFIKCIGVAVKPLQFIFDRHQSVSHYNWECLSCKRSFRVEAETHFECLACDDGRALCFVCKGRRWVRL